MPTGAPKGVPCVMHSYLRDESGDLYGGVYRDPATSATPVVFGAVLTDRGDVVELLDASGAPFAAYRYDAWGNPLGLGNVSTGVWSQATSLITSDLATEIATRQVLRYASYCYDSESGFYYLSARSYDPTTRQFISKDLSRNDGEESAYAYAAGNPIKNIDPNGYFWGWLKKAAKKVLKVVQKVADVVSFVPGVGTIAGFVSLGARVAGDAVEGGWKAVKKNWKSYAVDAAFCATGLKGVGKVASRAMGVVAKKAGLDVAKTAARKVIGATGKIGEEALGKLVGGTPQKCFSTSLGGRFVDRFAGRVAHEAKVGYTTASKRITRRVMKDAELIRNKTIKGSVWHFYTSPVTNRGGASAGLQKLLRENGIGYVRH